MDGWKNGPTASSTASGKFGKLMGTLGNSKIGGMVGKVGANPLSWLGSATLSYGSDKLKENGYNAAGSVASVGAGALSGASTGALIGSVIPGLGTAAGAIIGGALGAVTSAITEWNSSESAAGLAEADSEAVDQSNRYQSQSLEQERAMVSELRRLNENMGYNTAINARGVAVAETGNRQLANMQYGNA
jgi:phage tail tape-measure protein